MTPLSTTYKGPLPDLSTDEKAKAFHERCQAIAAHFRQHAPAPKAERAREWRTDEPRQRREAV